MMAISSYTNELSAFIGQRGQLQSKDSLVHVPNRPARTECNIMLMVIFMTVQFRCGRLQMALANDYATFTAHHYHRPLLPEYYVVESLLFGQAPR